jgi:hypothetical protein
LKNIAVIYSPDSSLEITTNNYLYKFIPAKYRALFLSKMPITWNNIELKEMGCEVITVQFPYLNEELAKQSDKKVNSACRKIYYTLQRLEVEGAVLEYGLHKMPVINNYFNSQDTVHIFNGKNAVVTNISEVLKYICLLLRTRLDNVRLGIIVDEMNNKQIDIVKEVSGEIRFLSILSYHTENLIPVIESVYEETGLAIDMGSDVRDVLTDCGILINFSKDANLVAAARLPEYSVIINCGIEMQNRRFQGIIINDVFFYNAKISAKGQKWISQSSFCEAVISNVTGQSELLNLNYSREDIKRLGYKVSGFMGVNGKIRMSEFEALSRRYLSKKNIS